MDDVQPDQGHARRQSGEVRRQSGGEGRRPSGDAGRRMSGGAPAPVASAAAAAAPVATTTAVPTAAAEVPQTKAQKIAHKKALLADAESKLAKINQDLNGAQRRLPEALKVERVNRAAGIGEDLNGNSIARLDVTVFEARNLPKMDMFSGKADPYVKLLIKPTSASADTADKRTEIKWKNLNPRFDQNFTFQPISNINGSLVMEVFDAEKISSDEYIAQVVIPFSDMLSQQEVEGWYPIADPTGLSSCTHKLTGEIRVSYKLSYSQVIAIERAIAELTRQREEGLKIVASLKAAIRELEGVGSFFKIPAAAPAEPEPVLVAGELRRRTVTELALDWLHNDLEERMSLQKVIFPTPGTVAGAPEGEVKNTDCVIM